MSENESLEKPSRRKSQNAAAQRTYRAKQRQRLQTLQRLAVVALSAPPAQSTPLYELGDLLLQLEKTNSQSSLNRHATQVAEKDAVSAEFSHSVLFACLSMFSVSALQNCGKILASENFGFRDIVKYGLIATGYAIRPELFHSANALPAGAWVRLVQSELGDFDIKEIFSSGIGLFATFDVPMEALAPSQAGWKGHCAESICMASQNLYLDNMSLSYLSFSAAFTENARQLGITPYNIINDHAKSPFCFPASDLTNPYNLGLAETTSSLERRHIASVEDLYKDIKPDLRPTPTQTSIPHHPCWDILPWADFRSKAILAASMNPPLINHDDLCLDLMNNGVWCWGGYGAPWDSRSWEAAPWFLEKWEGFTGGRDGEMWRNSSWWRSMRNGQTR